MNGDDRIGVDRKNSALRIWCSRDRRFRRVDAVDAVGDAGSEGSDRVSVEVTR